MTGLALIHWTIRLALACYAVTLVGALVSRQSSPRQAMLRIVWTAGCVLFVTHVVCAFHSYHHWSHAHVLGYTADETERLIGWRFGEGIYFSYAFTLLWITDVLWWWLRPASYLRRPRFVHLGIHFYLLFIAFNGAVVFEDGPVRWAGCVVSGLLALLLVGNLLGKKG